ncbi:phosphorylase b kinase gamma catalytic chain, skeletal muscle/heart isoform-like [Rhopilema esculentum]|uniref:phosphorylase b kinase gamma catalytic chain, skeletal muscle/heart isoform-like n=1 Tax=Rhopilema esculentum TaxID=499914 RepID=UPI0031E0F8E3
MDFDAEISKDEPRGFYEKYEPKETLGSGLSSVVRRCVNKETGREFAVKIIDRYSEKGKAMKGRDEEQQVKTEINTLGRVAGHQNIIKLVDVYESAAFFFLVFELAPGGELFDYLTRVVTISEKETRKIMCQIFSAVAHMHNNGVVHRDLKPENILFDNENKIVITDFGFAVMLEPDETVREFCGTYGYLAPETLKCYMFENMPGYGKEVDLWACGVILYTLLVGFAPFWHRKQMQMIKNITEGKYKFGSPEWDDISEAPKDLIRKLLVVDPKLRISADQALCHPWFEGLATPRPKTTRRFKAVAVAIITMKELYYTYHKRHQPATKETVIKDPYGYKPVRRMIDSCAFKMYSHWVKRWPDQDQNRAALFQNALKFEVRRSGNSSIPSFLYQLNSPWIKKASSYRHLTDAIKRREDGSGSR